MAFSNKISPITPIPDPNPNALRDEIQEIMAHDSQSPTFHPAVENLGSIQAYLDELKTSFLNQTPENSSPYFVFLSEYTKYKKNIFTDKFSLFKENLTAGLSSDDRKVLASRDLCIMNVKIPVLNFLAYFHDLKTMKFVFEILAKTPLEIFPDFRGKDVLEVAIELQNRTMIDLIIEQTSLNPPSFGSWKNLNKERMEKLIKLQINNLGKFLDSRVFPIEVDQSVRFSGFFFYTNSIVTDKLPLDKKEIEDRLINKKVAKAEFVRQVEFRFLDIKEYALNSKYLLEEINENFAGEKDIYGSNVLIAMAQLHWLTYGYVLYLVKMVIIALEFFYFFKITDYLRSDPTLPSNPGNETIVYLSVFYIIILLEIKTEIVEMKTSGIRRYFSSDDNLIDVATIIIYIIMVIFYTLQYHYLLNGFPDGKDAFFEDKLIVQGFFYFFMALRILWQGQVLPGMGFYIRMIAYTIKYIFMFFIIVVCLIVVIAFAVAGVAGNEAQTQNASWDFGNFYRIYKAALGDSSDMMGIIDVNLKRYSFMYFIYFLVSIVLQIILLNIVITLLADGYGDLKNYQKEFSTKTIISALCRFMVDSKFVEVSKKKIKRDPNYMDFKQHYEWYESVIFYIKFIFFAYFCNTIIVRRKFSGQFFVYSYLTGAFQEKVSNEECYLNTEHIRQTGRLEDFEKKNEQKVEEIKPQPKKSI